MIKVLDFPDKTFATKEELYEELRKSASRLIAVKCAEIYKSHEKGGLPVTFLTKMTDEMKAAFNMKEDYVYPVINTTLLMDSHRDVHFDGIWTKSLKDQQGKLFYICDHEMSVDNVIAWPEDVKAMVKSVPWGLVGKPYSGYTEALIYEIKKSAIVHPKAAETIEKKRPVQNSVRMRYVKIRLAINSSAEEDKSYKEYYDSKIKLIANKEEAEELGYFWGVEEAKVDTEGSMVLRGSNNATPVLQAEETKNEDTKSKPVDATPIKPSEVVFDFEGPKHKEYTFFN